MSEAVAAHEQATALSDEGFDQLNPLPTLIVGELSRGWRPEKFSQRANIEQMLEHRERHAQNDHLRHKTVIGSDAVAQPARAVVNAAACHGSGHTGSASGTAVERSTQSNTAE